MPGGSASEPIFFCTSPMGHAEHNASRHSLAMQEVDLCEAYLFKQTMNLVTRREPIDAGWKIRDCSLILFGAEAEDKACAAFYTR